MTNSFFKIFETIFWSFIVLSIVLLFASGVEAISFKRTFFIFPIELLILTLAFAFGIIRQIVPRLRSRSSQEILMIFIMICLTGITGFYLISIRV